MNKQLRLSMSIITLLLLINPLLSKVSAAPYDAQRQSLKGKVIVVDPGHGGSDTGAIGPSNVSEKNITLSIARDVSKFLSASGAKVILTRTSDQDVAYEGASDIDELQARVDVANQANADLFISIHADASSEYGNGTTTYFYPGSQNTLAHLVQDNMIAQTKLYNRGFHPNDYYVLKHTNMPAILTEVAFISNPKEEKLLLNSTFDKKVAFGIYNGIKKYFLTQ